MKKIVATVGLLIIVSIVMVLGCWTRPALALTENQKLVNEVWRIVNRTYVDGTFNHQNWLKVRTQTLQQNLETREETYRAIANMLSTLDDPFTRLLQPNQYRSLQVNTSGELTGVGLQIALDQNGKLVVVAPITGSPAAKAGLQARDRIVAIDGLATDQLSLDQAAEKMRGLPGSQVILTIERAGSAPMQFSLIRDRIALNPVVAQFRSSSDNLAIGYIRLNQFNANAPTEFALALTQLEQQGANAYILDLRNNPGGLLQAGIEIARLWLNEGTIVYTVNRQGIVGNFDADDQALTNDPLVVLVNQGTASASEILAGALQDHGRAQLVGEKTFGKGLIQSLFDLSDGSGLAVTIAKYETPNHHDIHKLGIIPDQIVSLDPITSLEIATQADRQYQAAVDLLHGSLTVAETITKLPQK